MKLQIKSRFTNKVLFSHDAEENSLRITLEAAVQAHADLAGAYLTGAYLANADLAGAKFTGAKFTVADDEEIARLDQVREIVLSNEDRLDMAAWHGGRWDYTHTPEEERSCGTPHCIAGWLQALSPDESVRRMKPRAAGELLAPASSYVFCNRLLMHCVG